MKKDGFCIVHLGILVDKMKFSLYDTYGIHFTYEFTYLYSSLEATKTNNQTKTKN